MSTELVHQAVGVAKSVRNHAYAPYSRFRVGAAVKAKGIGRIYGGCNVENASYGATICAERSAIMSMIADAGRHDLEFVVIVTDADPVAVPCALCLQVMAEFAAPAMPVHLASVRGIEVTYTLGDLLPHPFSFDR